MTLSAKLILGVLLGDLPGVLSLVRDEQMNNSSNGEIQTKD